MDRTIADRTDDRKRRELILYLASRSEEDPRFSSTKLNKLLFYCDFTAYRQLGQSITGHGYQKLQFGPAPKAMLPIRGTRLSSWAIHPEPGLTFKIVYGFDDRQVMLQALWAAVAPWEERG